MELIPLGVVLAVEVVLVDLVVMDLVVVVLLKLVVMVVMDYHIVSQVHQ